VAGVVVAAVVVAAVVVVLRVVVATTGIAKPNNINIKLEYAMLQACLCLHW